MSMLVYKYSADEGPSCPKCGNKDVNKMGLKTEYNKSNGRNGNRVIGPVCMACGFVEKYV
jgi:predicted nucleic-acid-binding Zn-ribbon protein